MKALDWFVRTLENDFHVIAKQEHISFEGTILYLDEIMESLIPKELSVELPESMIFETMLYYDDENVEWLGMIAMDVDTREWYYQSIFKDSVPVLRRRITK